MTPKEELDDLKYMAIQTRAVLEKHSKLFIHAQCITLFLTTNTASIHANLNSRTGCLKPSSEFVISDFQFKLRPHF